MNKREWQDILCSPGKEYRSAPFWAFNGRFEEENLRFQIREMKRAGMGGFFIHSREGLETPYLSGEWMEAVAQCVDEAEKQDMEVWIYDEDKWPSGCAGGLVSAKDPKNYTAKGITLEVLSTEDAQKKETEGSLNIGQEYPDGKILGIYTAKILSGRIIALSSGMNAGIGRTVQSCETPESRISVLILRREISAASEWYNGFAPTDNLNPEAVREFLNLTHEKYKEQFGRKFGKRIKGFFTDEPNCCDFYSIFTKGRPWLTWTDDLPEYFKAKRGYSPLADLPYLFFEGERAPKLRHDFWWTIAERFQETYMKQVYDWCEENGTELTGHILYENDLGYQARVCGAAMPQYKYLHRPGIDLLGEQTREYLTVKQCTSVARQYGRTHTITETYGCTGWEFGFEGQKWLGDWQFVLGIDRRCQHLSQYSITGCRKRDYPPVFSYQTTWWEYNHLLEDYFARISACLGQGEAACDVLVLHPMSSIWTRCGSAEHENLDNIEMNMGWMDDHITSLNQWGEEYNRLAKMLLGAHLDFDFGDEILMAQDGSVEADTVKLGCCRYRTVIVPRITSLFEHTRSLLKQFAHNGGRIIFTAPLPKMVEGTVVPGLAEELEDLPNCCVVSSYEELLDCLNNGALWKLEIRNKDGQEDSDILTAVRKLEGGYLVYAVNNDRERSHPVTIRVPCNAVVTAYDPWTDTFERKGTETRGTAVRFFEEFTPARSRIYFVAVTEQKGEYEAVNEAMIPDGAYASAGSAGFTGTVDFPYVHPHYADPVFAALGPAAKVRRTMENVLTLDTCRFALGTDALSEPMQVWQAQKAIRERLGMQQVWYNGAPQRYFWLAQPHEKDGTEFTLSFTFSVKESPAGECSAVIEKPLGYTVRLNGVDCVLEEGYFLDRDMKRFRLPKMEAGEQTLTITGPYSLAAELEDIFIIGGFAVDNDRCIVRECGKLHFGDWCFQGYYHYPGSMIYEFDLPGREPGEQEYILKTGEFRATLAAVRLNGQNVGCLMGNTIRELNLTAAMQEKSNHLEIEVVGSPRNMFGPLHQTYTGCSRISWADFRTEGQFYTPDYVLEPYGIFGQITICLR